MSGETEKDASAHTVDTALAMMNQRFRDLERLLDERHTHAQMALDTAREAALREINRTNADIATRFTTVNEFRAQLADQAASFTTRVESEAAHKELQRRVDDLNHRITEMNSRIDLDQGSNRGANEQAAQRRAGNAQMIALAVLLVTTVSVAVGLILALNG